MAKLENLFKQIQLCNVGSKDIIVEVMNSLEPPKLEFLEPQEPMDFLKPPESKELPCPWSQ